MISEVHPSLDDSKGLAKSISNETLDLLVKTINSLQAEKQQRVVKVCSLRIILTVMLYLVIMLYQGRREIV